MSIKEELAYTGQSVDELAAMLGCTDRTLRNRMSNPRNTKLYELHILMDLYHWSPEETVEFIRRYG